MLLRFFYVQWWECLGLSLGMFALSALAFILPNNLSPTGWKLALVLVVTFALAGFVLGGLGMIAFIHWIAKT